MTSLLKISIVIPVRNGMDTLHKTITGIQNQSIFSNCEVIVIDSGSTDGTVEFLSQFPFVKVIPIDPKTFNHGATRNLAIDYCNGEFIFMTVQDAWIIDREMLSRMVGNFEDPEVMGVCGNQIVPREKGTNPHQWSRPQTIPQPKSVQFKIGDFLNLSPKEQFSYCGWDNVVSMYRASGLKDLPFITTQFAEDLAWAKSALIAGHKIVYDPRCKVNHYHHSYPDYVFKRFFIVLYSVYRHFGYPIDLSVPKSTYYKVLVRNVKWKLHPSWILFNIKALLARDKANALFKKSLQNGENELESTFKKVCGEIPQGKINKNK